MKHIELFFNSGNFAEPTALDELEKFAKHFKQKRIKLGWVFKHIFL